MADQPNELEEKDANPLNSLPLGSQAAQDFVTAHAGVAKAGQVLQREPDGDAQYTTISDYEDKNHDGIDDDEEDVAENDYEEDFASFESDSYFTSGLNSEDYSDIGRDGARNNQCFTLASDVEKNAVRTTSAKLDAAYTNVTQGPVTADKFMAYEQARIEKRMAATAIVAKYSEDPAAAARAAQENASLTAKDNKITALKNDPSLTDQQKMDVMKKGFGADLDKIENGTLPKPRSFREYQQPDSGPRSGASYSSAQNDLPGGTTEQPFGQKLNQLFASAVTPPATVIPAPVLTPAAPIVQAPAYNG